jgi:Domain of unknown function (DUF4337)
MAEEKKENWLNYLSATTILIAVCATLSTFKGGSFSTKSLLSQTKASDQWAYYQAKSIKQSVCEMQKENLEIELGKETGNTAREQLQSKIGTYAQRIKTYKAEKDSITGEAQKLEDIRENCRKHSENFGMAVIFLQIAVLLSSLAALLKKKYVWLAGVLLGAVGMFYFVDGFLLFY